MQINDKLGLIAEGFPSNHDQIKSTSNFDQGEQRSQVCNDEPNAKDRIKNMHLDSQCNVVGLAEEASLSVNNHRLNKAKMPFKQGA